MQTLSHPFIIEGKKFFTTKAGLMVQIMEYANKRDLRKYISKEYLIADPKTNSEDSTVLIVKKYMKMDTILSYFTQLVLALEDAHSSKMTHRNLSSENIYLKETDDPIGQVLMLGNFGNTIVQSHGVATASTMCVSDTYYMSPENIMLFRPNGAETDLKELQPVKPGKKSDIFALGIILLELCCLIRTAEDTENAIALYEKQVAYNYMLE